MRLRSIFIRDEKEKSLPKYMTSKNGSKELISLLQYMKEMNILDIGIAKGREEGRQEGIQAMIKVCEKLGASCEKVEKLVIEEFSITEDKAKEYIAMYW